MALNRIELSDIHDPTELADAVHVQLGAVEGVVPVERVAKELDIQELTYGEYDGFAGMLLTNRVRGYGGILADTLKGMRRARFSVAHELGHFLLERHVFSGAGGFACAAEDMRERRRNTVQFRQEAEANEFAIELPAPPYRFADVCGGRPDLGRLDRLSSQLDVSLEATVRQFVRQSNRRVAVVFHKNGLVRYPVSTSGFPTLSVKQEGQLSDRRPMTFIGNVSELISADPKDWFNGPPMAELSAKDLRGSVDLSAP